MRFLQFFFTLCFCLGFTQCGPNANSVPLSAMENAQAEALLRHLYDTCPMKAEVKTASLMLTAEQREPSEAFRAKFKDLGPRMLLQKEISAIRLADVTRIVEKTHGPNGRELVLLLQVTNVTSNPDKTFNAVGAWAFKDAMQRREFKLTPNPAGGFTIEPGKVLEEKVQPEAK